MPQTLEARAENFDDFCAQIKKVFADLDDPAADREMDIAFPASEFPLMPMHVESMETMSSINDKVMSLTNVVMTAARHRLYREKGVAMDRLRQFIVRPGNIEESDCFSLRLTKK